MYVSIDWRDIGQIDTRDELSHAEFILESDLSISDD